MAIMESMAGADEVLAGIKRNQITGLPPQNLTLFTATGGDAKVTLNWNISNTVVDDQLLCTVKGIMIRRSTTAAPASITDGTLVVDTANLSGSYEDTGLTNDTTYYYRAFAYSDHGVYNLNAANVAQATPKEYILLGFKIKKNESDPAARVTYTEMAEGLTPASTNLSTGAVDLGDFANFWFITENKPCMVKYDGTIDYYLDPDDYTKKEDGVTASDVSSTSYAGNAMAKIPLTWLKIWQDSTYIYVNICDTKLDDDYHAYAHTRADGTVMDHIFMAMFEGSLTSSKVRSLKGQSVMNSQTGTNELTYAKANGSLWSTQSWSQINLINMLLVLLFKSTNLQATLGNGHYSGGSQASHLLTTGTISDKGQFYGTSGNVAMKCFHIENFYGDCWNRIEGCVTDANKQILIKPTPTYNTAGTGYTATGIIPGGTSGGYINAEEGKAYGIVPKTASGSDSTYTPDGLWFAASCYALVGGSCTDGLLVGPFALSLNNAVSYTTWNFGAALSCEQPAA